MIAGTKIDALERENRRFRQDDKVLREACRAALVELMWLADQVKARAGGSVDRAINACKNALDCPECGGSGSVVKAGPLAAGTSDTYQEPCDTCANERAFAEGWQEHVCDLLEAVKPFVLYRQMAPAYACPEFNKLLLAYNAAYQALQPEGKPNV